MPFDLYINIEGKGDSFAGDPAAEVARVLRNIANKIERDQWEGKALDSNGNTCAKFWVE